MRLAAVFLGAVSVVLATAAEARTWRIRPGPDAEQQLQTALIQARRGDTVRLGRGRFELTAGLSLDVDDVTLAQDLRGDEGTVFASGTLMLESEQTPLAPAGLHVIDPRHAQLTLTEGRYHQVRRMFAAVGNHVDALHRSRVGGLTLDDLTPGQWRVLGEDDLRRLFETTA